MKKFYMVFVFAILAFAFSACGGGSEPTAGDLERQVRDFIDDVQLNVPQIPTTPHNEQAAQETAGELAQTTDPTRPDTDEGYIPRPAAGQMWVDTPSGFGIGGATWSGYVSIGDSWDAVTRVIYPSAAEWDDRRYMQPRPDCFRDQLEQDGNLYRYERVNSRIFLYNDRVVKLRYHARMRTNEQIADHEFTSPIWTTAAVEDGRAAMLRTLYDSGRDQPGRTYGGTWTSQISRSFLRFYDALGNSTAQQNAVYVVRIIYQVDHPGSFDSPAIRYYAMCADWFFNHYEGAAVALRDNIERPAPPTVPAGSIYMPINPYSTRATVPLGINMAELQNIRSACGAEINVEFVQEADRWRNYITGLGTGSVLMYDGVVVGLLAPMHTGIRYTDFVLPNTYRAHIWDAEFMEIALESALIQLQPFDREGTLHPRTHGHLRFYDTNGNITSRENADIVVLAYWDRQWRQTDGDRSEFWRNMRLMLEVYDAEWFFATDFTMLALGQEGVSER